MYIPQRTEAMQSPIIPIVGGWVRDHPGTISLGQGVVHYGPPPEALAQIERFLADGNNHKYQPVEGIPALVEAITRKLGDENNIPAGGASRVLVTAGGNMAFFEAVLAVTDPGDEIILLTPFYFNHEMAVVMAGCRPVAVPTDERYQPRLDAIAAAITPRTRAILTVSPNNPSGAVYAEAALRAVNELCRTRGLYHISDEPYEYFTYGEARHFSPGSLPGAAAHTISLFSLSKAYGFASWRIGYLVIPEALLEAVRKIQDTNLICPPVISQYAALGALNAGRAWCREKLRGLAEVRAMVLGEMEALGDFCDVPPADGAFYLLLTVRTQTPDVALVERLIREHGVAVLPGSAFGMTGGRRRRSPCTLRLAYGALQPATVAEGVGRLVRGLRALVA